MTGKLCHKTNILPAVGDYYNYDFNWFF